MPQWTGPKGLIDGWGYVYAREEVYWPLSCPALPVTCDGKVLCLGQTLHVASPAAEAPQTSQHSCLHQKPLTLTDTSARAQGVPRGLSGLVEAGGRRHGLSPGHWQVLGPAWHFGERPLAAFQRTKEQKMLWEEEQGGRCVESSQKWWCFDSVKVGRRDQLES